MLRLIFFLMIIFFHTKAHASEDVCFEIQKNGTGLSIFGRELGVEKFKAEVDFSTFTDQTNDNFYLYRTEDRLWFQYQNESTKELFGLLVRENGDVEFRGSEQTYTGWKQWKTYGIRTFGMLENYSKQAFYHLITDARELHNYGTIHAYSVRLAQNYLFNKGSIRLGEMPTDFDESPNSSDAQPSFKTHTVENYGLILSRNMLQIKDGLHYHEHGISDFENLETSGGDMQVEGGGMEIKGRLSGRVRDLSIQNSGTLTYKESAIKEVRDLSVGIDSIIHGEAAIQLKVSRNYTNQGSIMSDDKISLQIENLAKDQTGTLYAPNGVNTRVMSAERAKVRYEAECREVKQKRAETERQARISQENAKKEREAAEKEAASLRDAIDLSQQYVDWAEKLVEAVRQDERDAEMVAQGYRKLDDGSWLRQRQKKGGFVFSAGIGSSGFHVGGHTRGYDPFPMSGGGTSPMMQQAMAYRDEYRSGLNSVQAKLRESMAKVERLRALERQPIYTPSISMPTPSRTPSKVGTIYTKVTPSIKEARDREYISKLSRAIGSDRDKISALETELRKLRDRPETRVEYEEVRHTIDYDISDLKRLLDSPAQRFIDDFAIPVMTVGSALFPGASVATAPAVATTCARFIPTLGRAAIAFGAEEAYQRITTFLSEKSKGGGEKGRVSSTPSDADSYLNGLRSQEGLLSDKQITVGKKYEYYKFLKNCEYRGIKFRKGDYISRDTRHNEWEWFRGADDHRGAIDPLTGKLYKGGKRDRVLQIK